MLKIAVLADIHANFEALKAVSADIATWGPDRVIVNGDIVNRGPRPIECLDFIQTKQKEEGWVCLLGNHEEYVISRALPEAQIFGPAFEVHRASFWTFQQLNGNIHQLSGLPRYYRLDLPAQPAAYFTHASVLGLRAGIYPETSDEELRKQIASPASLFCVGHTHRPFVRWLDETLVVNAGSTGLPFDGDQRACYARLIYEDDRWEAEILRVEYDLAAAESDFFQTGYFQDAGPLIELVLIELREARSQLYQWAVRYQELALSGEISMQESVRQFLRNSEKSY